MQLKYMYSSEWFSMTEFLMINVEIPCECIKVMQILRFPTVMKLQARKVRKHSHPNPKHHDFLQVRACTWFGPFSWYLHIYRKLVWRVVRIHPPYKIPISPNSNKRTCTTFHGQFRSRFLHLIRMTQQYTCRVQVLRLRVFMGLTRPRTLLWY